jgi:hypothetical protein
MNDQITEEPEFIRLQFNQLWIDAGVITAENFALIKRQYVEGEDRRSEHYRWGAFQAFMRNNVLITKEVFHMLYELAKGDDDISMGRAMIFDIIKRLDCPQKLVDRAINDNDITLSRYALKCKTIRETKKRS